MDVSIKAVSEGVDVSARPLRPTFNWCDVQVLLIDLEGLLDAAQILKHECQSEARAHDAICTVLSVTVEKFELLRDHLLNQKGEAPH